MNLSAILALCSMLALGACGAEYHPGVSGQQRTLNQNLPANGQPEPPGARPR